MGLAGLGDLVLTCTGSLSRNRFVGQELGKGKTVTEITKAGEFYPAEDYHQNYYRLNKNSNPYCSMVIAPKLKKLGLKN